ncbi:MAG: hypothetical protein ACREMB_24340, partial [Candidatus Rokuibacteriota bacterium]
MRPGGHLTTAVALGAAGYAATGSLELTIGAVAGAFLIDVDHYTDYLTVEGRWRRPGPLAFLRYYFGNRARRLVLPLHSLELLGALAVVAAAWPRAALLGYVAGAWLHLVLDILVNGEHLLRRPLLFYCLSYRARHAFAADALLVPVAAPREAGTRPIREFFGWRPPERRLEVAAPGR